MSTITPYQINIPDDKIDRLNQKLALADFPQENIDNNSWERGAPVGEIERLAKAWKTSFDWRAVEVRLNKLPHFTTSIDIGDLGSFDVHFVHKKSNQTNAIPLLFLHGWPGSFHEVSRILDPLVEGDEKGGPTFHVVAPSLIDFGFSSASKPGFQMEHHAESYDKLMQTLGYNRYVIQAGDVGSIVARYILKLRGSSRCLAYHTNTPLPSEPNKEDHPSLYAEAQATPLTESEQKGLVRVAEVSREGSGYMKIQSTKPTTIGYSLRDSPVGLLAWIYEKLYEWSDDYQWTDEEILTWVSIYYFSTAGPDASSNIYYLFEHSDPPAFAAAGAFVDVPTGISRFNNDFVLLPKLWNKTLGPIVYQEEHARGGHFAAWEQPDAIVGDLRAMFGDSVIGPKIRDKFQAKN
ncbi:hypothetical protein NW762_012660 [Fusarium torreyae]|uniref:Epoxide hydrolase N-terminal domain-containing protein n=1 Tax=Fusarium torreyae TaxID=1237075 RepID=A0A9W8V8N3_9HYPO|nr:hypothetical protein NW762_012660 [Fusarium torreyae]